MCCSADSTNKLFFGQANSFFIIPTSTKTHQHSAWRILSSGWGWRLALFKSPGRLSPRLVGTERRNGPRHGSHGVPSICMSGWMDAQPCPQLIEPRRAPSAASPPPPPPTITNHHPPAITSTTSITSATGNPTTPSSTPCTQPLTYRHPPPPLLLHASTVKLRLPTSFTTAPAALISPLVPPAIAPLADPPPHSLSLRPLQQPRFHRTMAADTAPHPRNRSQQSPLASRRDAETQGTAQRFGGPMFPLGYKESLGQWVCAPLSFPLARHRPRLIRIAMVQSGLP